MFTSNPFADLTVFLPPLAMQIYIVLMIFAVVIGTVLDMLHKSSAKYFALDLKKSRAVATRRLSATETASLAVRTIAKEVVTSGEFCNSKRRISHLLMFYGFLLYITTTVVMIFGYSAQAMTTPVLLPVLWHIGALMICIGGYWFFFFLR
ncbi:MAG: adenylyl-sulfate reductase, partial [Gammaproteobacteria bacterium]